MFKYKNAQGSIEYIAMVGFSMLVLTGLIIIFFTYTNGLKSDVNYYQTINVLQKVADAAENAYYLGYPTQFVVEGYIPTAVSNITVNENYNEIVAYIQSSHGTSEAEVYVPVNISNGLQSSLRTGNIKFKVMALKNTKVNITYVQ